MKTLIALLLVSSCVDAASTNAAKKPETAAEKRDVVKQDQSKLNEPNALDKKEADCDTKAKKPVEIIPETVSLGGNAGCSLDEAKP